MAEPKKRFFSIKWKLCAGLIGLSMGLVSLYVYVAKNTFETDKIAYVFDTRQGELKYLAQGVSEQITRSMRDARTVLSGYDYQAQSLNAVAKSLFDSTPTLEAIQQVKIGSNLPSAHVEKDPQDVYALGQVNLAPAENSLEIASLGFPNFAIVIHDLNDPQQLIKILVRLKDVFPSDTAENLIFVQNGNVLDATGSFEQFAPFFTEMAANKSEMTSIRKIDGVDYLVAAEPLNVSGLQIFSIDTKKSALSALGILYRKSIGFFAFSMFLTLFISITLAAQLTRALNGITVVAQKIGQGDFSAKVEIKSNDEVGVLGRAFTRMAEEIQMLLQATKEKTRMESELKTARLVQESLFPRPATFDKGVLSLSGFYTTSTECGGDWWYYFEKGDDLYIAIADATGHGTPAALITSAARALFSNLESMPNLTLLDIAKAWDRAVAASSNQQIFMTAMIFKFDCKTGNGLIVNCSHENPVHFKRDDEKDPAFIKLQPGSMIGKGEGMWTEAPISIAPGERLLLYTDGMRDVKNPQGETMGERRFFRSLKKLSNEKKDVKSFIEGVQQILDDHRQGEILPDDVTLLAVENRSVPAVNEVFEPVNENANPA